MPEKPAYLVCESCPEKTKIVDGVERPCLKIRNLCDEYRRRLAEYLQLNPEEE